MYSTRQPAREPARKREQTPVSDLPVTRSVSITESGFPVFGLKGFGFLYVFAAFLIGAFAINDFLVGLGMAAATFLFIRTMVDGKPRDFLLHLVRFYITLPKHYHHRPGVMPGSTDRSRS